MNDKRGIGGFYGPVNYDFVPFPKKINTSYKTDIKQRKGKFSGIIRLTATAVDNLFIGSGYNVFDEKNGLIKRTVRESTAAVIPGSAVKGVLRQTARAVSDGCISSSLSKDEIRDVKENVRDGCHADPFDFGVCIVCDMFGAMSLASKVSISDFIAPSCPLYPFYVPQQFGPNTASKSYEDQDGYLIGYKFYKTKCETRPDVKKSNVINGVYSGTAFSGEIVFNGLDKQELELLLFSLGLTGTFSQKLGGFRAEGFGTVNFSCSELIVNGAKEDAAAWAKRYKDDCSEDCKERIRKLETILVFKDNKKGESNE